MSVFSEGLVAGLSTVSSLSPKSAKYAYCRAAHSNIGIAQPQPMAPRLLRTPPAAVPRDERVDGTFHLFRIR